MPTLDLPDRFKAAPFHGDYYKIMGLNNLPSPTKETIEAAYRIQAKQYHPDKIATSLVHPPLKDAKEANECFVAIAEIKAILLSQCVEVMHAAAVAGKGSSATAEVSSASDLSFGEQLKAVMLAYVRSARFCEYPLNKGPGVPGYWSYIAGGKNNIEMGTSKFSGQGAIATPNYQVEQSGEWDQPLIVFDKSKQPFIKVSDPQVIKMVFEMMATSIPEKYRDDCAKTYGGRVRESATLAAGTASAAVMAPRPLVIEDPCGNNYVDGVRRNADDSFTILARNSSHQPREITLFQDGSVLGFNRSADLGIVGRQLLERREEIFQHFDLDLSHEIPSQSSRHRMGY